MNLPDLIVFGDAGGPALVGGFFFIIAIIFLGVGFLVGLLVFLIARARARSKMIAAAAAPPDPSAPMP